jgi:glycosyltransferase involved in cell wall biosynthesis
MKYQLNVHLKNFDLKHAGTKAVQDCEQILEKHGYQDVSFNFNKSPYLIGFSLLNLILLLTKFTLIVEPKSLIITPYPLIGINRIFKFFIRLLKAKQCIIACIIHDINTLRYEGTANEINQEIENLNAYNLIIAHNNSMIQWLKNKGLTAKTFNIQIFDYLYHEENKFDRIADFSNNKYTITFAGNLNRGKFVNQLFKLKNLQFNLFGPTSDDKTFNNQKNVAWKGSIAPEDLVTKLQGTFALIWDGDRIENCEGQYGNYIQYNNPHKISLYLAAGLPIIIPAKAALSEFVEKNKIGFTIKSLNEIEEKINKISLNEYQKMVEKLAEFKEKVKRGFYFSNVVVKIEQEYALINQTTESTIVNRKINRLKDEKINLQS